MGKQKLQAKTVYCLGYAKGFSGRSRKGGRGGSRGFTPLLKGTYMTRNVFNNLLTICLKLKLLPLKDHIEGLLFVYSTNTDGG